MRFLFADIWMASCQARGVYVTQDEVLELFEEAQRLGHKKRRLEYGVSETWTKNAGIVDGGRRRLPPLPGRQVAPYAFTGMQGQAVVRIHLPPLQATVVRRCACSGYWEQRPGSPRPVHVGKMAGGCG
jgi:hypothetical protein